MLKYLSAFILMLFLAGSAFGATGDYVQEGGGYLGTAATRDAEDTLTNGSNLPDGAAIITYGTANWGGGTGYWTETGSDIYYTTGNVGVGTATPAYPLDVTGRIRVSDTNGVNFGAGTTAILGQSANNRIDFYTNAVNRMTWASGGNVGIGDQTPGTLLEVAGVITATGGTSTNWNTAYTDRLKWDGGASSLISGTALTSLGLDGVASAVTSGAYYIGVYDEFIYSSGDTVQEVLADFDYAISQPLEQDSEVKTGRSLYNSTTGREVIFTLPAMDDTNYDVIITNQGQYIDAGLPSIESKTTGGFTLKASGTNTTNYFDYYAIPYTLRGSTQQDGSDTFNSTTGVTVSLSPNLSDTNYDVIISLSTQTGIEDIGAISVESKAVNQFVVKNSGADTTSTFNWLAVPYTLGTETDPNGNSTFAGTAGQTIAIGADMGSLAYVVLITSATQTNLVDVGVVSIESKTQTTFKVVNSGSGTGAFYWRAFPQVAGMADMYRSTYDVDLDNFIDLAAGGLDDDVSGYSGLLKVSGGAVSQITDSSTNWDTAYTHSQAVTGAEHGAVSANTANKIVRRDASGNFIANEITGNIATATALKNARTIGGVSFDGTANIIPGTILVVDESADTENFLAFFTIATGPGLLVKTGTNLTFNSATGALTATSFVGPLTGNSTTTSTATTTLGATVADTTDTTSFVALWTDATGAALAPKSDGALTYNANTGVLSATGFIAGATKFVGDVTGDVTGDLVGNVTGNVTGNASGTAGVALTTRVADNESSNETNAVVFLPGGDLDGGDLALESDGTFNYNPSTGTVTSTVFVGALTGAVTGNADTSTVGITARVTDNESTNENNVITFVANADADGGDVGLESDGNLYYNPSTGTLASTIVTATTLTDGTASMSSGALTAVTSLTFTGADAIPNVAGEIQYDSTITGMSGGGLRWYDNDSDRLIVDLETDPSTDDYVVAYDADADGFYMKLDVGSTSPSYSAGSGIALTGTEFTVAAGAGLGAGPSGLYVIDGGINAVRLASTTVTPGTYTNTTLTVDGDGRITDASTGSGSAVSCVVLGGCDITANVITVPVHTGLSIDANGIYIAALAIEASQIEESGVAEANYFNPSITVNAQGLVTFIESTNQMYVNANDYGADFSQAALETAIAEAVAMGGGACGRGATVFLEAGLWTLTDVVTVAGNGITIMGEGPTATLMYRTFSSNKHTINFDRTTQPAGCGSNYILQDGGMQNLSIDSSVAMPAGYAHINIDEMENGYFSNLRVEDGNIGIRVDDSSMLKINNVEIRMNERGYGLYGMYFHSAPSSVMISNVNIWGVQGAGKWQNGIQIEAADGLWFDNLHVGMAEFYDVNVKSMGSQQNSGLRFTNSWFDSPVGIITSAGVHFEGTTTAAEGLHTFTGCMFQGGNKVYYGVHIAAGAGVHGIIFNGNTFFGYKADGMYIQGGTDLDIKNNKISNVSLDGSAVYSGIRIANGVNYFSIFGNSIGYNELNTGVSLARYGILLEGTSHNYYTIMGNRLWGNTTKGMDDNGTGANKSVTANAGKDTPPNL